MTISAFDRSIPHAPMRAIRVRRGRLAALRMMGAALRESLFAYRRYEHLKQKGTPHRTALTRALDQSTARIED